MLKVWEDIERIHVTGDKVTLDSDPTNLFLLIQGILWFLSSACQPVSLLFRPSCNSDLAGHHLFSKGERCRIFSVIVFI